MASRIAPPTAGSRGGTLSAVGSTACSADSNGLIGIGPADHTPPQRATSSRRGGLERAAEQALARNATSRPRGSAATRRQHAPVCIRDGGASPCTARVDADIQVFCQPEASRSPSSSEAKEAAGSTNRLILRRILRCAQEKDLGFD